MGWVSSLTTIIGIVCLTEIRTPRFLSPAAECGSWERGELKGLGISGLAFFGRLPRATGGRFRGAPALALDRQ